MNILRLPALAGMLALASLAAPAAAATFTFSSVNVVGGLTVNVSGTAVQTPFTGNTSAGVFFMDGTTGSPDFDAFCVDLSRTIGNSPNWVYSTSLVLPTDAAGFSFTAGQQTDARKLAAWGFGNLGTLTGAQKAGLQVAIWKTLYPNATFSGSAAVNTAASTYLNTLLPTLTSVGNTRFLISQNNPMRQNLIVSHVPEPATWAMLIAGFGLVGATVRRRRATLSAVHA